MAARLTVIDNEALSVDITITGWSEITRKGRNATYLVAGTSVPVVIAEVHGPRETTLTLRTADLAARDALDAALSAGSALQLTVTGLALPSMRVAVGDYSYVRAGIRSLASVWTVPLVEVGVATVYSGTTGGFGGLTATAIGEKTSVSLGATAPLGALTATALGKRTVSGTATAPLGELTAVGVRP